MIFYFLAAMVLGGYFVWAFFQKRGLLRGTIPLEVLASIWLEDDQKVSLQRIRESQCTTSSKTVKAKAGPALPAQEGDSKADVLSNQGENEFSNDSLTTFYERHVVPHRRGIQMSRHWEPLVKILRLIDQSGNCPSIIMDDGDPEYQMYKGGKYEKLAKVTLADHCIRVGQIMLGTVRKKEPPSNAEYVFGKALITALGHDLGKIPAMRKDRGYAGAHQILSCAILNVILEEDCPDKTEIMTAVREHHAPSFRQGTWSTILVDADRRARSLEIGSGEMEALMKGEEASFVDAEDTIIDDEPIGFPDEKHNLNKLPPSPVVPAPAEAPGPVTPEVNHSQAVMETAVALVVPPAPTLSAQTVAQAAQSADSLSAVSDGDVPLLVPPNLDWMDGMELLRRIEPKINIETESGYFVALAQRKSGIVYVMPGYISEVVSQMADERRMPQFKVYMDTLEGKRLLEMAAVNRLREQGSIPSMLGDKYHSRKFKLINTNNKLIRTGMYTPIYMEAFHVSSSALEDRKSRTQRINKIAEIIPA